MNYPVKKNGNRQLQNIHTQGLKFLRANEISPSTVCLREKRSKPNEPERVLQLKGSGCIARSAFKAVTCAAGRSWTANSTPRCKYLSFQTVNVKMHSGLWRFVQADAIYAACSFCKNIAPTKRRITFNCAAADPPHLVKKFP